MYTVTDVDGDPPVKSPLNLFMHSSTLLNKENEDLWQSDLNSLLFATLCSIQYLKRPCEPFCGIANLPFDNHNWKFISIILWVLSAVWVRAYKNAWNLGKSTATCLFTFPREKGGLQVKLPLGTLFTSVWGNLERCNQFDDGTRQMQAICYQEALQGKGCLDLLELQDTS